MVATKGHIDAHSRIHAHYEDWASMEPEGIYVAEEAESEIMDANDVATTALR